jgi:hypothetical protein
METSTVISICAALIALFSLYQSYLSQKLTVISNIENQLTLKAQDCNKYIIPDTQGHPLNTQNVSAVVTAILYAKSHLALAYKNHGLLLFTCDEKDFIKFFSLQLHSSIIELVKNKLPDTVDDLSLRPIIENQQLECKKFLSTILK